MISNNGKEETHIVIGIEIMLSDGVRAANEQLALVVQNDQQDKSVEIYPNPANDFFVVYNYGTDIQRAIQVYDANGRLLKQARAVSVATRITTGDLRAGVYIVRVIAADGSVVSTQKVVIRK